MSYFLLYVFLFTNGNIGYYEEALPKCLPNEDGKRLCEKVLAERKRTVAFTEIASSDQKIKEIKLYCTAK